MSRFNTWLMVRLSRLLSSPYLFYVLFVADAVVIALAPPNNLQTALLDFSSIFLQSVALVIINNTTGQQGDRMEAVLRETHDVSLAEHEDTQEILTELHEKLDAIQAAIVPDPARPPPGLAGM